MTTGSRSFSLPLEPISWIFQVGHDGLLLFRFLILSYAHVDVGVACVAETPLSNELK